jgi:hypothetical protein
VIPVLALWFLHNGDLYLLTHRVSSSDLGVYRLASRLGSPPSYFASAFIMTWSPLEHSALVQAAFHRRGRLQVRAHVSTYYLVVSASIVVAFVLFSRVFVLLAPPSYAEAAKVAPLVALGFVMYGAYIVLLRTARPDRMLVWYAITAVLSAVTFAGSSFVLIPALGIYGAPLALILGMTVGCVVVLIVNSSSSEPLPLEYGRILALAAISGVISAAALISDQMGHTISALVTLAGAVVYLPALVLLGVVPRSDLRLVSKMMARDRGEIQTHPADLPAAEQEALVRYRRGSLSDSANAVDYARFTRALRRIGGVGAPSGDDEHIGVYLASREPNAVRDLQIEELIARGVDAYELHLLDRLAKAARRRRFYRVDEPTHRRRQLRARARALQSHERAQLAGAVAAASQVIGDVAGDRRSTTLTLVRALRTIRRSLGIGAASQADVTFAQAMWQGELDGLSRRERAELRHLRTGSKLALGEDERWAPGR